MNYTEDFQKFWQAYPKRWSRSMHGYIKRKKAPAFKTWQKLSPEIKSKCLRIVKKIKYSEGEAVRDCVTWLNQEGWDDIEEPQQVKHLPEEMTNNVFRVVNHHIDLNQRRNEEMRKLVKRSNGNN